MAKFRQIFVCLLLGIAFVLGAEVPTLDSADSYVKLLCSSDFQEAITSFFKAICYFPRDSLYWPLLTHGVVSMKAGIAENSWEGDIQMSLKLFIITAVISKFAQLPFALIGMPSEDVFLMKHFFSKYLELSSSIFEKYRARLVELGYSVYVAALQSCVNDLIRNFDLLHIFLNELYAAAPQLHANLEPLLRIHLKFKNCLRRMSCTDYFTYICTLKGMLKDFSLLMDVACGLMDASAPSKRLTLESTDSLYILISDVAFRLIYLFECIKFTDSMCSNDAAFLQHLVIQVKLSEGVARQSIIDRFTDESFDEAIFTAPLIRIFDSNMSFSFLKRLREYYLKIIDKKSNGISMSKINSKYWVAVRHQIDLQVEYCRIEHTKLFVKIGYSSSHLENSQRENHEALMKVNSSNRKLTKLKSFMCALV